MVEQPPEPLSSILLVRYLTWAQQRRSPTTNGRWPYTHGSIDTLLSRLLIRNGPSGDGANYNTFRSHIAWVGGSTFASIWVNGAADAFKVRLPAGSGGAEGPKQVFACDFMKFNAPRLYVIHSGLRQRQLLSKHFL